MAYPLGPYGNAPNGYNESQPNAGYYVDPNSFQIPGASNYLYHPQPVAHSQYNPAMSNIPLMDYNGYYSNGNPIPLPSHMAPNNIGYGSNLVMNFSQIPPPPMVHTTHHPSVVNPSSINSYYGNVDAAHEPVFNQNGEIHQQTLKRVIPAITNKDISPNQISTNTNSYDESWRHQQNGHAGQPQIVTTISTQPTTGNSVYNNGRQLIYKNSSEVENQPEESSQAACTPVFNLGFLNESISGHNDHGEQTSARIGAHLIPNNFHPPVNGIAPQMYLPQAPQQLYDNRATHYVDNSMGCIPRNGDIPRIPHVQFQQSAQSYNSQVIPAGNVNLTQGSNHNTNPSGQSTSAFNNDRSVLPSEISRPSEQPNPSLISQDNVQNIQNTAEENGQTINQSHSRTKKDEIMFYAKAADMIEQEIVAKMKKQQNNIHDVTDKKDDSQSKLEKDLNFFIRKASHGIVREKPETYADLPPFVHNESANIFSSTTSGKRYSPNHISSSSEPKHVSRSLDAILDSLNFQSNSKEMMRRCAPKYFSQDGTLQRMNDVPKEISIPSREEWWRSLPKDNLNHSPSSPSPQTYLQKLYASLPHAQNSDSNLRAQSEGSGQRYSETRPALSVDVGQSTRDDQRVDYRLESVQRATDRQNFMNKISSPLDDEMFRLVLSPRPVRSRYGCNEIPSPSSKLPTPAALQRLCRLDSYGKDKDQGGKVVAIERLPPEIATLPPGVRQYFCYTATPEERAEETNITPTPKVKANREFGEERNYNTKRKDNGKRNFNTKRSHHPCKNNEENYKGVSDVNHKKKLKEDERVSSLPEMLAAFINVLRNSVVKDNDIQTIENGLTSSRIGLKSEYTVEDFVPKGNRPMFFGSLSLSGIFLARATGLNKKSLKHKVYEKALKVLTSHTAEEVLSQADINKNGNIKDPEHGVCNSGELIPDLKYRLGLLQSWVKTNYKNDLNILLQLQKAFLESQCDLVYAYNMTPVYNVRGLRLFNKCQLLVEGKILSSVIGIGKRETKTKVTEKMVNDLLNLGLDELFNNMMKNDDKEIENQIEECCERESKSKRTDPALLLDLLKSKVEREYAIGKDLTSKDTEDIATTENRIDAVENVSNEEHHHHHDEVVASDHEEKENVDEDVSDDATLEKESVISGGSNHGEDDEMSEEEEDSGTNESGPKPWRDVLLVSKACIQLRLKLTTIFKKIRDKDCDDQPLFVTCQVYLAERLLSSTTCTTRKESQYKAFRQVCQALLGATRGQDILDQYPVMDPEDLKGEDIIEISYKGYAKVTESNRCRLHRSKRPVVKKKREASDLVILEHEDWSVDRVAHANCILKQSASMSGLLLEWTCEEDYGIWRCDMTLQGHSVARCVAKTKREAIHIASVKALYSLYETQPIVKGYHGNSYSSFWVTRKDLHSKVRVPIPLETVIDMDAAAVKHDSRRGKEEDQLEPGVEKAIESLVSEFFQQPTLKELVIAPDWTASERQYLRYLSKISGLRYNPEDKGLGDMVVLCMKLDLAQYVEILKDQPCQAQGRYRLVPDLERPSLSDVAGEIAINESFVRGIQSNPVNLWLSKKNKKRSKKDSHAVTEEGDRSGEYVTANNSLSFNEEVFEISNVDENGNGGNNSNNEDDDDKEKDEEDESGNCMNVVMPVFRRLLRPLSTSTPDGKEKKDGGRQKRRIHSESGANANTVEIV